MKTISHASFLILLSIVCAISVRAQSSVRADEAVGAIYGRIEQNTYINDVLDFKLTIPSTGVVLDRAQTEVYRNAGADYLKGDNKELSKKIDNEMGKQTTLFNYVSKTVGSADNSSFVIAVIREPAGATADLVLAETLKELSQSGKFELAEALKNVKVGGINFVGIAGKMTVNGVVVNIRFLVSMRKGYAFVITSNYQSDDGAKRVNDVIDSIQFQAK